MTVRHEPLTSPTRGQSPHLLPRSGAIAGMIILLRVLALLLIGASAFGNYIQFVGGWAQWTPINVTVILLAVGYQAIFSLLQWGSKAKRWWGVYLVALLASAFPSFMTYNAWAGPYIAAQIGVPLAIIVIGLAVIGADALPEWVLVE